MLLLNNDTIVDPDCVDAFVEAARAHPEGALFGAKIYYHEEPDRIWYAGARWVPEMSQFVHVGEGECDDGRSHATITATDCACGCALFVRISALAAIGFMDESFFLTFEETDWCYRARERGYPSYFVPQAKVWHKVSASFGGATSPLFTYYMSRNQLAFASKHLSEAERGQLLTRILHCLGESVFCRAGARGHRLTRLWQSLRDPTIRATLAGFWDYYRGHRGARPKWVRQLARF